MRTTETDDNGIDLNSYKGADRGMREGIDGRELEGMEVGLGELEVCKRTIISIII